MKNLVYIPLFLAFAVFAPAARAGGACGDPQRLATLLHEATYSEDRSGAESRLISASFPVSACLSREVYSLGVSGIPGRFSVILDILSALRRQPPVRMSTSEDVDRQLRLWKVRLAAK